MPLKPLLALLVFAPLASPQTLPARETLSYTVEWRLITAGTAKLEWTSEQGPSAVGWRRTAAGPPNLEWPSEPRPRAGAQVHLRLESVGLVSKFFRVEDDY